MARATSWTIYVRQKPTGELERRGCVRASSKRVALRRARAADADAYQVAAVKGCGKTSRVGPYRGRQGAGPPWTR